MAKEKGLARLALVAAISGALIGLVGGVFRYCLNRADISRTDGIHWLHESLGGWGWCLPVIGAALAAAIARWLVRFAPLASGSGVQHVEAVMRGEAEQAPLLVLPVKFFGGLLAIGAGMALGREGPTVQMGATIGAALASRFRMALEDVRNMQSALAGAGLAVAFNAPVGGALFVFEEVSRSFRLRLTIATLISAGIAIAVSRAILGDAPDFAVAKFPAVPPLTLGYYLIFGALLGLLGVAYNHTTILLLDLVSAIKSCSVELRAAAIGAIVGAVGWFAPMLIGGGDPLNEQLLMQGAPLGFLCIVFVCRWLLGPLSYSAGTPGGLFAPLLLVGSALGLIFATVINALLPGSLAPTAMAIVGMASFFTAVVRAPFTGIVLIAEMTATTDLFVPMLVACFGAMASTSMLGAPPIYDTLRERMLRQKASL